MDDKPVPHVHQGQSHVKHIADLKHIISMSWDQYDLVFKSRDRGVKNSRGEFICDPKLSGLLQKYASTLYRYIYQLQTAHHITFNTLTAKDWALFVRGELKTEYEYVKVQEKMLSDTNFCSMEH